MKMKLELKHLAPYLPYGLKYIYKGIEWDLTHLETSTKDREYKPILRPLSDLTKEIEVNGEKFVPFDYISDYNPNTKEIYPCVIMDDGIIEMHYWKDFEKLFEWHFDVFGLIDAGLAIDINTL